MLAGLDQIRYFLGNTQAIDKVLEQRAVHLVEEHLDVVRVVIDDGLLDDVGHHRGKHGEPEPRAERHHLAVAARPAVGVQPHEQPAAPAAERRRADDGEDFETGDLHPIMMSPIACPVDREHCAC